MALNFNHRKHAQRAQAGTTFSMLKRRLDGCVNAHGHWTQCRSLMLKAMILEQRQIFDGAKTL
jgi:hypothetical protein